MKNTNEKLDEIKEKLDYIGLDYNNIPNFFKDYKRIEYRSIHENEQKKYKIYKFIDVNDIQIYITPKNRMDTFINKFKEAKPIINYINPTKEEDIPLQANFFKMLKDIDISEIKKIEETQNYINKKIPFKISYKDNYLWEIYYSQAYNVFFMIVSLENNKFTNLFYLLKKQIESHKKNSNTKIYVPITYMEYTENYLQRSEINDIENYLWLFTRDWPSIYEVFDKKENMSLQIIGNTYVFDKLKSYYKIILKTKEESVKFYKYLKALFILQSELHNKYIFNPKIDRNGYLNIYYKNKKISYEMLPDFLENEYKNTIKTFNEVIEQIFEQEKILQLKQITSNKQEKEYHQKEKEIAIYLECRKSFFKRIKYYFKHKKTIKELEKEEVNNEIKIEKENYEIQNKQFYTIEDLININKKLESKENKLKNLMLDIKALDNKIETMTIKINNATQYINEIDKHNKSLFDFWKFTNKDEKLALNEGKIKKEEKNYKLSKTFDFETDFDEVSVKIDSIQRKKINKNECDAIYLTQTNSLELINLIKNYVEANKEISNIDLEKIKTKLDELKIEIEKNKQLFENEDFDIFGSFSEDNTKIKYLNGKKHREIEKNKYEILHINKTTTEEEFINKLENIVKNIKNAIENNTVIENMPIYKCTKQIVDANNFEIFNVNIENCINRDSEDENLYKINLKEGNNAVYLSNIIFFDNNNNTLPLGMDVCDKVLLDLKRFEIKIKNKCCIKINIEDGLYNKVKNINVYEYDIQN